MEQLWAAEETRAEESHTGEPHVGLTVRQVRDLLAPSRPLAYTTVLTVLDNLYKKGLARRALVGRAYTYRAVASREEHAAELMAQALSASADRSLAFLRFVDRMSAEDIAALRSALDRATRHLDEESS
ncbi:Predicted transcriptional regulator [Streptoalloteichus hindustanus]|uniref:Predicted transcriptional regulator n=2 Tax=Streptoalloteichus hindustanus TaxID=2017 RepID=A0A1M5AEL1_STRHI|nr:Predicted transcriptional regulator [Streptoalloteichus hindustanus]